MKTLVSLLFLAAGLLGTVPASDAKPIEFVFTAIVASAEPVFPTVHPGDLVVGKYFFESNTADSVPGDPTQGRYLSVGHFDAKIGALTFSFPLSVIEVLDNFGGVGSADRYTVAAISGNTQLQLRLLAETNPNAFTNDHLPLVPPTLSAFSSRNFQVYVLETGGFISKIDSNVITLVTPEPSALVLFVSGLAGLAGVAGWRKRGNI
jgi:hypothetical protein